MRILVHGINFSPEVIGIGRFSGELVEWLISRGHEVSVVTAPPYYPEWRVSAPYFAGCYRRDRKGVIRCPLWVPSRPSGLKRIFHLASFAASSFPVTLALAWWRPDVVWFVAPTLFCAPAALLTAKFSGASSWLHVQDFEVDAAFDLGLISAGRLRKLVEWGESWVMRRFDRVSTISPNMASRLKGKRVPDRAVRLFPNWVDTEVIRPIAAPNLIRRELELADVTKVVLYSGNMGNKQGLEILVAAAELMQGRRDVKFVFCGDGAGREGLMAAAAGLWNVSFMVLQPIDRLNELLNLADIHLLPQKADAADLVMPSKLTGMLASGRPVVATAKRGTQLAEIVEGKGIVVEPDDAGALANAIGLLADDETLRRKLGAAARTYAVAHLGKQAILTEFEKSLFELVSERRRAAGRP